MSRSSSMQFTFLTREQAAAFLARATMQAESYGDRVAAQRRLDYVTTAEERAASRRDAELHRRPEPCAS